MPILPENNSNRIKSKAALKTYVLSRHAPITVGGFRVFWFLGSLSLGVLTPISGAHAPGEIFDAKDVLAALGPDHSTFEIVAA